ncbi:MAG: alpha/beta hydrolase, partial [Betaproteobacteria bacterium]|nr:alpha/beta hydrolase [Betaproteobacteria bacterium]
GLQQLRALRVCAGPVSVAGFSFGGMAAALWLAEYPLDATQLVLVGVPGMGLSVAQRVPLKGWRHLPNPEAQNQVHRHNLMALMLASEPSLDPLALSLHAANVQRDRMPRRRLSSTDIVARTLPRLQVPVSAIFGEHDALYKGRLASLQAAMPALCQHWGQWHTVEGAGHWVQYEAAQAFDGALINSLGNERTRPFGRL